MTKIEALLCFMCLLIAIGDSRILTPSKPEEYQVHDPVKVQMNKVAQGLAVFDYYHLPYMKPNDTMYKDESSYLIKLSGNRKLTSLYEIKVGWSKMCIELNETSSAVHLEKDDVNKFIEYIDHEARGYLYVDGLPIREHGTSNSSRLGHRIGHKISDNRYILYTHLAFTITYANSTDKSDLGSLNVVSATVSPHSFEADFSCQGSAMELHRDTPCDVRWTYSVVTEVTDKVDWYQRWNIYYESDGAWLIATPIASVVLTLAECAILGMILFKVIRNESIGFVSISDSGWKSVFADVFRSPNHMMIFSVIIGAGMQIAVASFILMTFYSAGFLSLANQGSFSLATFLIFGISGLFGGYSSMRTYIMLGGIRKKRNAILPSEYPCHTNHIPRMIPPSKFYQNPILHTFFFGFLPFVVINVQIQIALESMIQALYWHNTYTLFVSFILMVINVVVINMLVEFYQLSREDYNWWWRSIFGPAFSAIYIFIYMLVTGLPMLHESGTGFYFFMYSLIASLLCALFFSSIGFLGNLWFTKKIYSTLHFD
eukprot:gene4068-4740_t